MGKKHLGKRQHFHNSITEIGRMTKDRKRLLLVEDDMNLGFVIQDTLSRNGYKVHLCRDGKEGLKYYNSKPIFLIFNYHYDYPNKPDFRDF